MLKKLKRLTKRQKIVVAAAVLLVAGSAVYFWLTQGGEDIVTKITEPDKKYYSQLTGNEVSKDESELPILGIMIENSEEARPQSGLNGAGIVFETVTEGGITRYLALYQENKPEVVGPIRSARPAFVNWGMGFEASFAHVGGSEEALTMLDDRKAKSMNQYFNDAAYYRTNDREAPHNMYARTKDLVAMQEEKGHKTATFEEIARSDDAPSAELTARTIALQFSHPIFGVTFTYDNTTNSYLRSLAGAPHIDAGSNKQISVKNVVIIKMTGDVSTLGSGRAQLFKDGVVRDIRWKQSNYKQRMTFEDENGNAVPLNRGSTWISVLPSSGSVSVQ